MNLLFPLATILLAQPGSASASAGAGAAASIPLTPPVICHEYFVEPAPVATADAESP